MCGGWYYRVLNQEMLWNEESNITIRKYKCNQVGLSRFSVWLFDGLSNCLPPTSFWTYWNFKNLGDLFVLAKK